MIAKILIKTGWLLLLMAIFGLVYIRLAPHDVANLHRPPPVTADPDVPYVKDMRRLVTRAFDVPMETALQHLQTVANQTPRTRIIAGSADQGMITYVTRSFLFGFPDYTTVQIVPNGSGCRVTIHARQRFGRLDFGVNSRRVHAWLQALQQAG